MLAEPESPVIDTPEPAMQFQKGDVLVIFGKNDHLNAFVKKFDL